VAQALRGRPAGRLETVDDDVLGRLGGALDTVRLEPGMLSSDIYSVLRDAIVNGEIPERSHLSQNPLADALGVSRTPLRDALLRLAQDGLIQSVGGRGYQVVPVEMTEVAEIYEVRRRLVEWALGLVRGRISPTDLWEARRIHQEMTNPEHLGATRYFDLNRQFHRAFIRSGPNKTLLLSIDHLWDLPTSQRMFVRYNADPEAVAKMIREHELILDIAERGDHDALTELVLAHISDAAIDTTAFVARQTAQKEGQ
jgi:DNA-binding GntR family transcriptional regulator